MAMIRFFIDEWRRLWHDGHDKPERPDAARLRHKLWRKEVGVGVILISDEVSEVFATCDRVLHMRGGRIIGEVTPGRVSEHELEERIYA